MFIDKDDRRFNPYRTIEFEGVTYQGNITAFPEVMARMGNREIDEPPRPDFSDDTHFVFPIDEPPYWSVTPKSEEMIAETKRSRAEAGRKAAYLNESDPVFFKQQRGEVPAGTWEALVAEIKARYPK